MHGLVEVASLKKSPGALARRQENHILLHLAFIPYRAPQPSGGD
jgi:hypothetical protein